MKKTLFLAVLTALATACAPKEQQIEIVPYPNSIEMKAGTFMAAGADFHMDPAMEEYAKDAVRDFAEDLALASGQAGEVTEAGAGQGFTFKVNPDIKPEGYRLRITGRKAAVEAADLNGFIYAIQTIKQMLPVEIYGDTPAAEKDWTLPCCEIEDAPRFPYRGQHVDEARHFYGIDEIKKILDMMEIHKMNKLHWHLTDDQGWRVEIKKYPRLTEVGSIRKETLVGHINWSRTFDGKPYGEGKWYTQDQIREVIDYAARKGITVIPEVDLPGHMLAALTAYPELGCTGGPYDVWGMWGVADDVLCAGKEEVMVFLENVLGEIADLFPSEYIHIGGDECPKVRWEECPHCQAKIKELGLKDDDRFKAEHYLQSYVMKRMSDYLGARGKKVIGWDEILEGDIADNAIVMSWRGTQGDIQAAQLGHDAIMTPNTYCYIDFYQSLDTDEEPLGQGGYLPVEKVYSYEPFIDEMTHEQKKHIIGVQTNLWTEYIPTAEHFEYMLLPRMSAISEVQWCDSDNKDWKRFRESADHLASIYEELGFNYATHIFRTSGFVSIDKEKGAVMMNFETQGDAPIRYTVDGSEPTEDSPLYEGPVEVKGSCTIKGKAFRDNIQDKTFSKEFKAHKAMGKTAVLGTAPAPHYTYDAPDHLVNGVRGPFNFRSGDWAGWSATPFEVTIDMEGETYSSVTLGTVVVKYDWIFNPQSIVVSVSEDGKTFTEVAKAVYQPEGENDPNDLKEYTLDFPETSARYLKVWAETITSIPAWHPGAGGAGFLFVDEVVVR